MTRTVTFLGWTFFGLFLVLGLLAWASLPSRIAVVLGSPEQTAVESPETARLQGIVLGLEERADELEASVEVIVGELSRRGELAVRAEGLASQNRDALNELRVQMGGLERQTDTVAKLLASVIAAREVAAASLVVSDEPPADTVERAAIAIDPEPPVEEAPVAETAPEKTDGSATGPRETIGFEELLARKRWRLWDEPTTFRIVRPASQVGFEGSSTVHDFSGSTRAITGSVRFDFSDPTRGAEATIVVDATTLDTQDEDRDEEMHTEHLQSATYPKMIFTLTAVRDVQRNAGGDSLQATASGAFEIHGQKLGVELPVIVSKRPGRRILIEGSCPLEMSSFGIEPPTALAGVIKTSDDILVRVRLEAEAVKP